jgi:competence protein ComEC
MTAAVDERQVAGVDVRLALGAAAAWLALIMVGGRSAVTVLVLAVVAAAVGLGSLLWSRRAGSPRFASVLGLGAFCVALVLVPFAGRVAVARASPLAQLAKAGADVTAELTVTGDPHLLAATGAGGAPRAAVTAEASAVVARGRRWSTSGDVLVLAAATDWRDVLPGQRVRLDGELAPSLDAGSLSVTMFARAPPVLEGEPPWWQREAGRVRAGLRQASDGLPDAERGLLPGLVDGDTAGLDPVLVERFRIAGLTHLVAVSGTNCSILVGAVLLALRAARVRPWLCAAIGAVVLVAFVAIARPSPSVLRAALMAAVALFSLATGRPRQAVPALSAATLGLLLWDPALAGDVGFAMSVLATAALLLLAPGWAEVLRRHHVPPGVAEAIAVATAAHLVTAPMVAAISGRVSLVAIPANVLAEPVVAPGTVFGFAAAALAPWSLPVARGCAQVAGWPCRWLVWVADHLGALPGAALPWPGGASGGVALLAVAAGLVLLVRRAGLGRLAVAATLVAAFVQIPVRLIVPGWPPAGWEMVACDVGQGDAIVLSAGSGSAVEIDAGPDPVAIDACLRDLHVHIVALLVFTHYHLDHVGGIAGVLHDRRVGSVLAGPLAEPVSGVALVHDALAPRGLSVASPAPGTVLTVGQLRLDVLAPSAAFHGTRSDPNNSSLVLRATTPAGTRILLPGDVEIEAQNALLDARTDLRADVLKVPHHGSAYSVPAFLAAVHARVGVISVGAHNDYGHPSPVLLQEMGRLNVPVRRTDLDGDVAVVGSGSGLSTVVRHEHRAVALGDVSAPAPATARALASVCDARMGRCQPGEPARSASTSYPIRSRPWSCSSATRNCLSAAPSARSPPRSGAPTPRSKRPSDSAQRSTGRTCTNCSAPRCSAIRAWSWCARPRTSAPRPWLCWRPTWVRRQRARPCSCTMPAARRERLCSRPRGPTVPSRSRARSSPAQTNGPTSCAPRSGRRAAESRPTPWRPWWTRSAATCASLLPWPRNW